VSGQLLRQVLASALFAVKFLLLTQNEEFIHLAALLTVVLKNRHLFPLMFSIPTPPCDRSLFRREGSTSVLLMSASARMGATSIQDREFLKLVQSQQIKIFSNGRSAGSIDLHPHGV